MLINQGLAAGLAWGIWGWWFGIMNEGKFRLSWWGITVYPLNLTPLVRFNYLYFLLICSSSWIRWDLDQMMLVWGWIWWGLEWICWRAQSNWGRLLCKRCTVRNVSWQDYSQRAPIVLLAATWRNRCQCYPLVEWLGSPECGSSVRGPVAGYSWT